jgi:hypothetical protein
MGFISNPVVATEGASGRPVAGAAVNPGAGVVPDGPNWIFNLGVQAVDGRIGGERQVPIAGRVAAEVENRYTIETFTLLKAWETDTGPWHFASSITIPLMQSSVEVSAYSPPRLDLSRRDRVAGLFDISVTPLIAGYRFSPQEHLSMSLRVWAPTGKYESGALANLGHNVWTFIPTLAYTRFLPGGWEASGVTTVNFSTRNSASDYQNAPLFTLDVLGTRKLGTAWAVGGIASWIEQLGDDEGPLPDRLDGFRGRELAVGPIVTFNTKVGEQALSTSFRWVNTVSQRNRFDRNTLYLSISTPLGR